MITKYICEYCGYETNLLNYHLGMIAHENFCRNIPHYKTAEEIIERIKEENSILYHGRVNSILESKVIPVNIKSEVVKWYNDWYKEMQQIEPTYNIG